jgi:hypothetical protein
MFLVQVVWLILILLWIFHDDSCLPHLSAADTDISHMLFTVSPFTDSYLLQDDTLEPLETSAGPHCHRNSPFLHARHLLITSLECRTGLGTNDKSLAVIISPPKSLSDSDMCYQQPSRLAEEATLLIFVRKCLGHRVFWLVFHVILQSLPENAVMFLI